MKKLLLSLFFAGTLFLFLPREILAADLNIDCPSTPTACSKTGVDPLFSSADDGYWYPGKSITKTLNLKNSGTETREMAIKGTKTSGVGILENVMHISIVGGTTVIWSGSVADFYSQDRIGMGIFIPGANLDYNFTVFMSSGVGDEYQNKETVFDLTLGFWGEPIFTPTPTPTPTPGGGGAVLGTGVSAPVCADTKSGIPSDFTAVAGPETGKVILSWTPPSPPYTYFLIAYSDNSSWPPKWGNPNVGNVSTYTVSGLGSGTYWFWLRAGNGCMPGDFVGPVSPGPIAGLVGGGVAPGFAEGVLGVEAVEGAEASPSSEEEVLGEEAFTTGGFVKKNWVWIVVALVAVMGFVYLRRRFKKN